MGTFKNSRGPKLFDISDVTFNIRPTKSRRRFAIEFESKTDMCLLKIALAMRTLTEKVEHELGILEDAEGEH